MYTQMNTGTILSTIDTLLVCESDAEGNRDGNSKQTLLPSQATEYEYENERFLVAWVLLTRLPQEDLDVAWGKHSVTLSNFAAGLLVDADTDNAAATDVQTGHVAETDRCSASSGGDNDNNNRGNSSLDTCYIRLVTQVTARLTTSPPENLKRIIYTAWKRAQSTVAAASPGILKLNVDVFNAFLSWIHHDDDFLSSDALALTDIWKVYARARAPSSPSEQKEPNVISSVSTVEQTQSTNCHDAAAMISVLKSVLDSTGGTDHESNNADEMGAGDDFYTVGNLERLVLGIFELRDSKRMPEELICAVLRWIAEEDGEVGFSRDLVMIWHGWLMKNIETILSKKRKNNAKLLSDPKTMDAVNTIVMAHVVSPDEGALRPMAWQCIARIARAYGWSWGKATSRSAQICTWCRLACGEWKIQLEEAGDLTAASPDRKSILDGCASLMTSVVQYLVGFDERPDKRMPLDPDGLLHLQESLEETISITSTFLNNSLDNCDHTSYSMIINVWSQLFSEVDLLMLGGAENVIGCLPKLLSVSNEEGLLNALVHLITTAQAENKILELVGDLDSGPFVDSIVIYMKRFWKTAANGGWLTQNDAHEHIQWACIAIDILVEKSPPNSVRRYTDPMLPAMEFLIEYSPMQRDGELLLSLRLLVDSYVDAIGECHEASSTIKESHIVSRAIEILEK